MDKNLVKMIFDSAQFQNLIILPFTHFIILE